MRRRDRPRTLTSGEGSRGSGTREVGLLLGAAGHGALRPGRAHRRHRGGHGDLRQRGSGEGWVAGWALGPIQIAPGRAGDRKERRPCFERASGTNICPAAPGKRARARPAGRDAPGVPTFAADTHAILPRGKGAYLWIDGTALPADGLQARQCDGASLTSGSDLPVGAHPARGAAR